MKIFFMPMLPLLLFSVQAFAHEHGQEVVDLTSVKVVSVKEIEPEREFTEASSHPLPKVQAILKSSDGKTYSLNFPFGIGEKLITHYIEAKKTFYIEFPGSGQVEMFYRAGSKKRVDGKDFYQLSDQQQDEVTAEFMSDWDAIPLRSQPMGMILNFVFESLSR